MTPADEARSALETALSTWREDGQPSTLATADPPILVADSEWTNGRKITGFEILRDEPSETDQRFTVALRFDGQNDPVEVLYIVIGTHPVSVFREDDYERTINMDNNPAPKKGPADRRFRR